MYCLPAASLYCSFPIYHEEKRMFTKVHTQLKHVWGRWRRAGCANRSV